MCTVLNRKGTVVFKSIEIQVETEGVPEQSFQVIVILNGVKFASRFPCLDLPEYLLIMSTSVSSLCVGLYP